MRKRSFDGSWGSRAGWSAILGVSIATSAAFTAAVVFLMSPRQVRFFNVRAPNLPDVRTVEFPGESHVGAQSPLLFFGEREVVLGTVASVIAPKQGEGVVVADRASWKEDLLGKAVTFSGWEGSLPARTFVVGFAEKDPGAGDLALAHEVAEFAWQLNLRAGRKHGGRTSADGPARTSEDPSMVPSLVFARVPGGEKKQDAEASLGRGGL